MKKILALLLAGLFIVKAGWSSPYSEHVSSETKSRRTLEDLAKILFPARMDGVSGVPGFRLIPKKKPVLPYALSRQPYHLFLEGTYGLTNQSGPARLQDPDQYGRALKTSSMGIAYPLTSHLTLDGRYAVVKSDNLQKNSAFLGGTYRFNAATSISVSYPDSPPEDPNTLNNSSRERSKTSAELKIHF